MICERGNTVFYNTFEWYEWVHEAIGEVSNYWMSGATISLPRTNCDTPAKYKVIVAIRGRNASALHILQADSRASSSACNHSHSHSHSRVWGAHFLNRIIFIHIAKFFIKLFWQHIEMMMIEYFFPAFRAKTLFILHSNIELADIQHGYIKHIVVYAIGTFICMYIRTSTYNRYTNIIILDQKVDIPLAHHI